MIFRLLDVFLCQIQVHVGHQVSLLASISVVFGEFFEFVKFGEEALGGVGLGDDVVGEAAFDGLRDDVVALVGDE